MRVAHIITGLGVGGAEGMLERLLQTLDREEFEPAVWSLSGGGPIGERIASLGVPVYTMGLERRSPNPLALFRLAAWMRTWKPDVVQTWMYHADLLGGVAAWYAGRIPTIWNIRQSVLEPGRIRRSTLLVARLCAWLSGRLPVRIVTCSNYAADVHKRFGYAQSKILYIPNGFDLDRFHPDALARIQLRKELDIGASTPLVGMVARFDPEKDHRGFLTAARLLRVYRPDVHFLLCGEGMKSDNAALSTWIAADGLESCCHLLGPRSDIPLITAGLDVATLSALGEGFPNVLGEAMACGVPVVATDVGDARNLVDDCGLLVPASNPQALASAWREMLEMPPEIRDSRGREGRTRIETRFNLKEVALRYAALYRDVVDIKT